MDQDGKTKNNKTSKAIENETNGISKEVLNLTLDFVQKSKFFVLLSHNLIRYNRKLDRKQWIY